MIDGGPGILALPLPPSPVSKLDQRHKGERGPCETEKKPGTQ